MEFVTQTFNRLVDLSQWYHIRKFDEQFPKYSSMKSTIEETQQNADNVKLILQNKTCTMQISNSQIAELIIRNLSK